MRKNNVSLKFVIGRQTENDPYVRLMTMEGNKITENIYGTETKNSLLASAECLRKLANYANKLAEEYENAVTI